MRLGFSARCQLLLLVLLLCLMAAPLTEALAGSSGRGGRGRGGGRRWDERREIEVEVEVEEAAIDGVISGSGEAEAQAESNPGFTIKKLYGERNDPPSPTYPRRSATGSVDTSAMYKFGEVPRAPQKIRLRGNRTDLNPNEGRVEVEHSESWGLVCDGHFGDNEANVACKSLGFKKGATSYTQGSFYGTGQYKQKDILLDQVRCSPHAEEAELTQCTHSHTKQCKLESTAGVVCTYNEGCEWGWFSFDGLCYRVTPSPRTPEDAAGECEAAGASLAYVLSEGENNFISNLMFTKHKNLSAVWTAGQFAKVEIGRSRTYGGGGGEKVWVFKDSEHIVKEERTFWFPGFADGSSVRPTIEREKRSCLAMSKIFYRRDTAKDTDVNYFWWDNVSCKTRLPFICQKLAASSDCYNGTGKDYMGYATRTEDGSLCESWGDDNPDLQVRSPPTSGSYGPGQRSRGWGKWGSKGRSLSGRSYNRRRYGYGGWSSQDHNYCRNPDSEQKPWCWVNKRQRVMGYCNLQQCGNATSPVPPAGPPKDLKAGFNSTKCQSPDQFFCPSMVNYRPMCVNKVDVCDSYSDCVGGEDENATFCKSYKCKKDEFYCSKVHNCIPTSRVCDKNYDCDYGDDETPEACKKYRPPEGNQETLVLQRYKKTPSVDIESVPESASTVTYHTLTLSQCQAKCDRPDSGTNVASCFGFLFSTQGTYGTQCTLLGERIPTSPSDSSTFTYYELIETCQPSQIACKNGHCISAAQQCNGFDDCGDFSDEIGPSRCPDPKPTFEVRLSSGKGPFEGRIEVKIFKEWGLVCDNGLDASMGDLVCKQLGYPLGHERLSPNARREFGRGSGKYLMSGAKCAGVTTSLYDCPHAGWKVSNCGPNNVAGLVCRRQRACTSKEFRCSGICIPLSSVCDRNPDCQDGSDEAKCDTMQLALRNGNTSMSGVLEVTRGGIPGAICDDSFKDKEVQVACRHLGFAAGWGRKLPPGTFQAPGHAVMWVQDVKCKGTEGTLFACSLANWGKTVCDVSEAVNIECGIVTAAPPPPPTTAPRVSTGAPSAGSCGQRFGRFPAGRIVNGYPGISGQFPWQVGIRLRLSSTESQQWCGGTIISDRWIVTASHCFEEYPKSSYILRIGDLDNTIREPLEREFDIDLLIKHPQYSGSPAFDYDITLLRVKPDRQGFITFNDAVQPACLPEKNLVVPQGTSCLVSGWGSMGTMDLPKNLMAANVPLIEKDKCNEMYPQRITDRMQCAGFEAGGIDSCQGDSGGPLVCKVNDRYTLIGATSWGEGCALPGAPGVYANVRNLRDWVDLTIRNNP